MRKLLLVAATLLVGGCGYMGEPLPPLANVPGRVTDLSAVQRGSRIVAQFTVPRLTTEGMPLKEPKLDLRAGLAANPFHEDEWANGATRVPEGPIENGIARAEFLSSAWMGHDVILAVRVIGANGKLSGWSNFVVLPVVAPPDIPSNLHAEVTAMGIRLTWQARGTDFRVLRRAGSDNFLPVATVQQPEWTDRDFEFGKSYSYTVLTIVKVDSAREAESEASAEISIVPEDRIPPAAPTGVHAGAAPNSIELSWDRSGEPDLAGYRVYRSSSNGSVEKIAETSEVPSYSDRNVEHGRAYQYAITAVDRSGNEGPRSAAVQVTFE